MKLPQILGKEIFKEIKMKNKFYFIFVTTAISFLFGKFLFHENQNPQGSVAYAQVKKLDEGNFVTREELFNDSSTYLQDLNIIEENMLGNNSFFGWIKSMFWPKK